MPKGVLKGLKINNTFGLKNPTSIPTRLSNLGARPPNTTPPEVEVKEELRRKKNLNGIQGTSGTNEYVASEHDDQEGIHKIWLSDFEELNKLAQPTMYRVGGDEIPSVDMESTW
ncbi:hypothetical protein B0H17DRAFT_1123786 [Mycena rosella]|uniref:Uncharacterized protein n=1 Tax=Mycena rosella TaxID=1033263 RepID=A0AAD7H2G9_MYCRO|nr:hypothetical protein B0H17DRAFT_1123786 [Mycena rosella]